MTKPHITRTYGPIHFEDLDPHRFEDLVRELTYDYKDWQTIEATGRSGNDDGIDIRAYEKNNTEVVERETDGEEEIPHPMDGNLWIVQVKREKEIGPKKVQEIISEINSDDPPYGYILAASANFSKTSYDAFREELRKKGVLEFYLWGKAELEDMLHMPKYDRILFTFFGLSFVSRKKTRTSEVKSKVLVKNKLYKVLGTPNEVKHKHVLIRDLQDTHYPYKVEVKDFDTNPKWKEYVGEYYHPLGVMFKTHRFYAYIDQEKKEYDFTAEIDLINRADVYGDEKARQLRQDKRDLVNDAWDFLPKGNQGHFSVNGFVRFENVSVIDDKGDTIYEMPHLFVEFVGENGPFKGFEEILEISNSHIRLGKKWKRVQIFPIKIEKIKYGKVYKENPLELDPDTLNSFKEYKEDFIALYDVDGRYDYLKQFDIVQVKNDKEQDKQYIQITHKFKTKISKYLQLNNQTFWIRNRIKSQLGRDFNDNEDINVTEFRRMSSFRLERDIK